MHTDPREVSGSLISDHDRARERPFTMDQRSPKASARLTRAERIDALRRDVAPDPFPAAQTEPRGNPAVHGRSNQALGLNDQQLSAAVHGLPGGSADSKQPASLLGPIKVSTAVEEVTDRLITTIALGEILPGSRLPSERDMAAMLQVGRNTIRTAIARLTAVGLVEIRRGRNGGTVVLQSWTEASAPSVQRTLLPRLEELEQLFDLCALVEGTVARTAAERRTNEDVANIRAALSDFAAAESQSAEQATDQVFHQAILRAAGNPQLTALNQELVTRISLGFPFEPWCDPELGGDRSGRALVEHTRLTEAIAAGEVEEAGRVAQQHSYISAEIIKETLERAANTLGH